MGIEERSKIEVPPELWLAMGLSPAALDLLGGGMTSVQYANALMAVPHLEDAIRVFANVLPASLAVRWVLTCIREVGATSATGSVEGIAAVEVWLKSPTDEHRREAFTAAEAADFGTPVGSLALAVFLSGAGSISPPSAPEVPAPAGVCGRTLAGALTLASVCDEPQKASAKVRRFAEAGAKLLAETTGKMSETKGRSKP